MKKVFLVVIIFLMLPISHLNLEWQPSIEFLIEDISPAVRSFHAILYSRFDNLKQEKFFARHYRVFVLVGRAGIKVESGNELMGLIIGFFVDIISQNSNFNYLVAGPVGGVTIEAIEESDYVMLQRIADVIMEKIFFAMEDLENGRMLQKKKIIITGPAKKPAFFFQKNYVIVVELKRVFGYRWGKLRQ